MAHQVYRHEVRLSGDLDMRIVNDYVSTFAKNWVSAKEAGKETGNVHIHIGLQLDAKKRPVTLVAQLAQALGLEPDHVRVRAMASKDGFKSYVLKGDDTLVDGPYVNGARVPRAYDGSDTLRVERTPLPLQKHVLDLLKTVPDDRTVYWYWDAAGNVGKSALMKYCGFRKMVKCLPVAKSHQLRAAVCAAGPRRAYFLDMPRTLGKDDSIKDCMCVIESLKNGVVQNVMYGKDEEMYMESPHVVCFANYPPPREMLSGDRWRVFHIPDMN